ncbi:MAG TPA: hypothetical protein EYN91_25680 [Candidatus Melainabacteria bacterium]|nr:hypothetical protein [Candidatus Melainabacteria bacterium]
MSNLAACISIKKLWSDDDLVELEIRVSDGTSCFCNAVYIGHQRLKEVVKNLDSFKQQIHGGIWDMKFGEFGPEFANGGFIARLNFQPSGKLDISVYMQSKYFEFTKNKVASEARLYLRTEPALLDKFVEQIRALSKRTVDEALLECVV